MEFERFAGGGLIHRTDFSINPNHRAGSHLGKRAFRAKPLLRMESVGEEGSGGRSEEIGEPVKRVVSGTAGGEGLMIFVQRSDQGEE